MQVVKEMQQIEARAQSVMTQEQIQQALWYAEQEKQSLLAEERQYESAESQRLQQQTAQLRQMNTDTLARKIGAKAGLDVRNNEELYRVRHGLPLKRGTPKPTKVDATTLEQATVNATRHLDAKGEGFTPKQWRDKLEHLWEYAGTSQFAEQARMVGVVPTGQLKSAMTRYQEQEMISRLSGDTHTPEYEVRPEESDVRRATIARKMALELAKNGTDREMDEFHRPELYNHAREIVEDKYGYEKDSTRQDVAAAVLQHWPDDEAPEEYEYDDTPPETDVDDIEA